MHCTGDCIEMYSIQFTLYRLYFFQIGESVSNIIFQVGRINRRTIMKPSGLLLFSFEQIFVIKLQVKLFLFQNYFYKYFLIKTFRSKIVYF